MPPIVRHGPLIRLARVYDLTTGDVVDGVEIELPPGTPLPRSAAEAHAAVDAYAASVGLAHVAAGVKKPKVTKDQNADVETAVVKVHALAKNRVFQAAHGPRHLVHFGA